jgi:hypothetical protein
MNSMIANTLGATSNVGSYTVTQLLERASVGDRAAWASAFGQIYCERKVPATKMLSCGISAH